MINGSFLVCLVFFIGFGMEILRRRRLDQARTTPRTPYHLYHGPKSGCPDCEDK